MLQLGTKRSMSETTEDISFKPPQLSNPFPRSVPPQEAAKPPSLFINSTMASQIFSSTICWLLTFCKRWLVSHCFGWVCWECFKSYNQKCDRESLSHPTYWPRWDQTSLASVSVMEEGQMFILPRWISGDVLKRVQREKIPGRVQNKRKAEYRWENIMVSW